MKDQNRKKTSIYKKQSLLSRRKTSGRSSAGGHRRRPHRSLEHKSGRTTPPRRGENRLKAESQRGRAGGVGRQYDRTKRRRQDKKNKLGKRFSQRSSEGNSSLSIPTLEKGNVRIIPLGGVEEVGRNMALIEFGNDIIVVDAGFQFVEEETPGIDYILPNTKYLEERKEKIRGLLITHGHLDHIGGIPYLMDRIGNPPIYTRELSALMIKKRQAEFPHQDPLTYKIVKPGDRETIGNLPVRFFGVTHSIPDSMGVAIETPHGNIVLSGDLKLNHVNGKPTEEEQERWKEVASWNNLVFIADSTNAEQPGFSTTEAEIHKKIEEIIKTVSGRLIVGTFASQFERMIKIIELADKYGKKVITEGRSIRTNIEVAKESGRLKATNIIPVDQIETVPSDKLVILATGAQGEEFAALMRIGNNNHRYIKLTNRDTILLSSSIIPGNETSVQKLKDALYQHDVRVIHYRLADVHASGHGNQEELKWINQQVGARFFMPAYGYHSMLRVHAQTIRDSGFPKDRIVVPHNGSIVEIHDEGKKIRMRKEVAPRELLLVDGFSVGGIQEVVIRDRQTLAQDGMFVVIVILDVTTGKLRKSPDLISRGFVYLRESQELLQETRNIIKKTIENVTVGMHPINFDYLKNILTDSVSQHLFQQTNKRPIVIPVILGI